ncbi:MAG: VCBS repeat-containing protein, partial [Planctomycetaceae bacterium]|nr:VCBS repeat-containing protein [Planctomycetaceae bacterium]
NNVAILTNTTTAGSTTSSFSLTTTGFTSQPHGLVLADLNGDGKLDVITVNQGSGTAVGSGSTASIRLNTTATGAATPSFSSAGNIGVGSGPRSIAALDVNGDGKLDLVTANRVGNNVSVLISAIPTGAATVGAASFTRTDFSAGSEPYAIRTADLNGDGRGDLIVGNRSSNQTTILFNTTDTGNATPTFAAATSVGTSASRFVSVADFNLDGRPDFAASDASGSGISLFTNTPSTISTPTATGTITNDDAPHAISIVRNSPTAAVTNATALSFAITFSHAVSGVDPTDFITIGDAIATITNVSGSGASWLVSVEVAGDGSVNLQLVDDDSIVDVSTLKLGGTGAGNGDFSDNAAAYTIDLTPPTLTPILTPAANGFGWNNTDVQLTFDPSDNLSGVNLASLQGNTTFTNEGIHSPVQGNVADNAGNVTSVMSPTIRIDKTVPTLTFEGTNVSPNANGWFRTDVIYTYSASDDSSGIPTQPTPVTVTGEGSNLGFVLTTEDRAGNQGSVTVNGIKIDRTAPTVSRVTSTSANGSYGPGASVNLTIEFSEAVSLVGGTLTITLNNGAQVTLAAGSFTNSQTASASYVIQAGQAIANLDVTEVRLDVGAELLDRADNPLGASSGVLTIPPGQSLGDLKNITILGGQAVQFTIASQIVDETNGTLEVVIELNGAATSQVSIPLTVTGTAANGSDYNFVAAPAVIPIGSSQVTLVFDLLDDAVAELPETITITLGTPIGAPLGSITQHTVILLDNELPELRINDVSVTEGNSGTRQLTFTVTRLGDLQPALNFNYATQNDTATAPSDFTAITGSGILESGATSASFTVTINGDTTFEGDESLLVNLTGVSGVIGNTPAFGATSSIVTGNTPLDMATGDFNLDGLPDLVTADFQANGISVHLGTSAPGAATASFATGQSFALGASPSSLAVTDFNGDGKPDIVAVNRTPGVVLVRLNTTTPGSSTVTFAATQTFSAGTNPAAVAVGDVNRDGLPDVIVANAGSSNVSILRNTTAVGGATAAFAAAQSFGVQASPTSVAVGDLNGDGDVDIVVGNEASDTVSVLFNSTTANSTTFGFAPAGNFAVGTTPRAVAIGDLNNDGRADLVVANRGSNTFSWLRNTGTVGSATPSFDVHQSTIVTTQVVSVLLVDQNLDGKLDVAVTSDNANSVAIFKNRTSPGATTLDLEMLATLPVNSNPEAIVAADFDLDGRPDLATVSGASSNVVTMLNTTELPAATPTTSAQSVSTQTPVGAVSADLNGDGLPEIISANDVPGTISVFRNTATPGGSASFATAQDFSVGSRPLAIVVADVNGDGRPDVAVTNYNASSVSVLINTTAPGATTFTFEPRQALTVPATPTDLVFADLNRDGLADLIVTARSNNSVNAFINTTVPGDLTVSFGAETSITTGLGPVGVAAADLNGDGLADLAITAYTSGEVSLLRNTTAVGSATASFAAVQDLTSQVGVQGIAIGDFNRDGRADLAVTVRSANLVSVLLNTTPIGSGTLSFDLPQDLPTGAQPLAIVVGDLDRDGIVDLATANAGDGTLTRFMNRTVAGDSVVGFLAGSNVTVGSSPRDIALADFNLDGIVDLFAANRSANGVSVAVGQLTTIADANGLGTIFDDDSPPVANVTTTAQSVGENAGTATVVVQLSFVAGATVTIPFSVTAGNATGGGTDYALAASPVTIPAGASTAAITITINNDLIVESNETLTISLGTPSGATLGATTSHTLTIVDNDVTPSVSFASASQSVNENVTTTTVVVQLSSVAGQTVTIPFSVGGGSASGSGVDYSLSGSPVTILAGASTAAITVTVNNDLIDEPDETVLLNLGTPTNANLGAVTQHTVTIVDNDPPPVVEFVTATQSVNENATTATVIVWLSTIAGGTVTIPFSVSGGTATGGGVDYTLSASPLTINAGASTGAITLTITNDALDENDETLTLNLGTPSGATVGAVSQSTVTITDDDAPPSVQFTTQSQSLGEASGTSNIFATLSAPSAKTVSVPFTVSGTATDTTDYSLSGASFLFLPGQTSTFHTITIVNDTTAESNETVILTLGTPSNASLGTNVQQTITILDNDSFPGVTLAAQQASLAENGGSTTVVATLGFAAPQTVTIQLDLSGSATSGVDYSASTTAIIIPAGQLTGSVAISTLNDFLHEGDESVVIDITSVTGATETGVQQATISITDDAADPFELVGNTLNLLGTAGNDRFEINYGSSTTSFSAVVNDITQSFTATTINIDGLGGSDVADLTLSSLADDVSFAGRAGTINSPNYTINLANMESQIVRGNALDSATFNDTGAVQTSYLLPVYAIMQEMPSGARSQAIGFGDYTANAAGNNDAMFIYGDAGVQSYTSTPTQSTMPVGSQTLIGNNFQKVYAYGMGGADTATYSGSSADETMTSLAAYTFVNTATTVQYFDRFIQLTIAGNGGFDVGVMYDSTGNDTWTASDGLATFAGTTFRNIATGYDRIYAFQYFGGRDTATITGGSANDTLTGTNKFTVLVTPVSLLQATGFTTVIVTAGSLGTDVATVVDSVGVDTLVAAGNSAEFTYANGRKIRVVGFDTVNAKGTTGGVNRRTVTNPLTYVLKFSGTWV